MIKAKKFLIFIRDVGFPVSITGGAVGLGGRGGGMGPHSMQGLCL
jgi:hypothetical protein